MVKTSVLDKNKFIDRLNKIRAQIISSFIFLQNSEKVIYFLILEQKKRKPSIEDDTRKRTTFILLTWDTLLLTLKTNLKDTMLSKTDHSDEIFKANL